MEQPKPNKSTRPAESERRVIQLQADAIVRNAERAEWAYLEALARSLMRAVLAGARAEGTCVGR